MASELDDLRTFMEQRIVAADPTIDVSAGSPFDTEVITPLIERLSPDPYDTPIDSFAQARLKSEFADLVLQKGEPIDDLVVKPFRILFEPFRRVVTGLTRNQSLARPEVLNDREADFLAANFFATRQLGGFAVGVARLYFSAPRFILVTPTNAVFTAAGLRFFPVENQALSADNMLFNKEGSLFFFDVVVRAENQGEDFNIEKNTLVGIEGLPAVVKVTNPADFDEGGNRETTEEFLLRVEQSLSEKSLVTGRGIRARMRDLFESVRSVTVIGFGDPEMKRDLITGSPEAVYAVGMLTAQTGSSSILLGAPNTGITDGDSSHDDFVDVGIAAGDKVDLYDLPNGQIRTFVVEEIISINQVRVSPAPPDVVLPAPFAFKSKSRGSILLSDIPGGIIQPQTPNGEIVIVPNQVHIGGVLDVFIRAGDPQGRTITIASVRDGSPLHFGLDLESFGADADQFVQVTPKVVGHATTLASFVGPVQQSAEILIRQLSTGNNTVPWKPAAQDIGRFVELLGSGGTGAGTDFGLYEIEEIIGEELFGGEQVVRIQVSTFDEHTGTNTVGISNYVGVFNLDFRIVDKISKKSRVRDRDFPQADFNGDNDGLGAVVGDSLVIETGSDAGIYSIRRILTHIGEHDTLVLDRDLTTTVTPTGSGDGSGMRYRLADALQVDLVDPRVVKIPLGGIFLGEDLQTVADNPTVLAGSNSNFLLAGVEIGDTLEILEGVNEGLYEITAVAALQLDVSPAPPSTGFNLKFTIFRAFAGIERPLVRVTGIELLDSSQNETGIKVPYGDVIDARILGKLSNRANGKTLESFHGITVSGAPFVDFQDMSVDFIAQGVRVGFRLEILEGDSIGEYEIEQVVDANNLKVIPAGEGGKDFVTAETELHYVIGEPSSGIMRLYFLEPTSVEIDTGLLGARIEFQGDGQTFRYRYSKVEGRQLLPAPGSTTADLPRDLRVVRSYQVGLAFESVLEITDTESADAFDAEIFEGDVIEVNEQIRFKNSAALTFAQLGIYGTAAGLHTLTGSNRVFVPTGSRIDFTQMGDLAGQLIFIDSGPDAGQYKVVRVIDAKTIELGSIMTSTTAEIKGQELATPFDAFLVEDPPASGKVWLRDNTDFTQLGDSGDYISIFETKNPIIEGVYQIVEKDLANNRVRISNFPAVNVPFGPAGSFSWIRTSVNTNIDQKFKIYNAVPKELEIVQVATKAPDVKPFGLANIINPTTLQNLIGTPFSGVVRGDQLEILTGPNRGVYPIQSATNNTVTTYAAHPFTVVEANAQYRIWAGIHGPRRMLTVTGFEGSDGRVQPSDSPPYRIRRPGVFRVSSTEMESNAESGLFFADLQIESMGPGDNRNLDANTRMVVLPLGHRIDGYTYSVKNNNLTFSPFEEVSLTFDRRFLPVGNSDLPENHTEISGRNIQVEYETSPTVNLVNNLLRSDAERPNNANPVARHFLPSFVLASFIYEGGSSAAVTGPELEDHINNLDPLSALEVSDLEAFLTRRGATSVRHPIVLVSVTHDLDRRLVVERSENLLGGSTVPYNGSARISSFFAKIDGGLTVQRL